VTFIELIFFIVVVGIGVAGILLVYTNTVRGSSDPLVRKQLLAVAEALLEEVELMPFTYCDPDDAHAATAGNSAVDPLDPTKCAATPEALGGEGETRYSAAAPYDNVSDYHGFSMAGVRDITNTAIGGLGGYSASVSVAQGGLGIATAADVLRITVTVTAPGGDAIVLDGYRTRHAPNALP
jgi:MSHA pilin protein MshD